MTKAKISHTYPVRMVEAADYVDGESCEATVLVPHDSPYIVNGALCPEMCLEIMAQCFAAGCGHTLGEGEGYLAAVRDFRVQGTAAPGEKLDIRCLLKAKIGSVLVVEGTMRKSDGTGLAQAEFKIYIKEDK